MMNNKLLINKRIKFKKKNLKLIKKIIMMNFNKLLKMLNHNKLLKLLKKNNQYALNYS